MIPRAVPLATTVFAHIVFSADTLSVIWFIVMVPSNLWMSYKNKHFGTAYIFYN
jgi:hypothetical protein